MISITVNTLAGTYNILADADMELWLDANQIRSVYQDSTCNTPVTADLDPIGCIRDLSKNNNNGRQPAGTSRPQYRVAHQNGNNSMYFADDFLAIDNEANFDFTGNEFTIFMVTRSDSFSVSYETFFSKGDQSFSSKRQLSSNELRFETGASCRSIL
jgi:hypothetical protein